MKRKKRSLWNILQQFGTHTEQFHFRAFSRLFQWMLPKKRNLHWKFLQEHRPFHVSQLGSSAFILVLLLLLSLFLCPQSILSGSYTSVCPQHLQCLSPIQHQNPTRNVFVATISLPILVPTYSTSGVQERCIFQSIQLEKIHTENSKADSAFLLERHGSAPRVSSPGTSSWLHSRNPAAPLLWERKAMGEAEKSNTSPFRWSHMNHLKERHFVLPK